MFTVTVIFWLNGEPVLQKSFLFKDLKVANKFMKSKYKELLNDIHRKTVIGTIYLNDYFEINYSDGSDVTYWLTETQVMEG